MARGYHLDVGRRTLWRALLAVAVVAASCGPPAGFSSAAEAAQEAEAARAVTSLPPGATFPPYSPDPGGAYQRGAGRSTVEFQAACAWYGYWAEAIVGRDDAAIADASRMADRIREWSVYQDADQSLRNYWDSIVERARLGDPSGLIEHNKLNCS